MSLAAIVGVSLLVAFADLMRRRIDGHGFRRFWPQRNMGSIPSAPSTVDSPVPDAAIAEPLSEEPAWLGTTEIVKRRSEIPAARLPLAGPVHAPLPSPRALPFSIRTC